MFEDGGKKEEKIKQDAKIGTSNDSHKQQCNSSVKIEISKDYDKLVSNSDTKIEPSREKHNEDILKLVTLYLDNH
jgi:hypothetical protein